MKHNKISDSVICLPSDSSLLSDPNCAGTFIAGKSVSGQWYDNFGVPINSNSLAIPNPAVLPHTPAQLPESLGESLDKHTRLFIDKIMFRLMQLDNKLKINLLHPGNYGAVYEGLIIGLLFFEIFIAVLVIGTADVLLFDCAIGLNLFASNNFN